MASGTDVEYYIKNNYTWQKLPVNIKQSFGDSSKDYDKAVFIFSVKNQLRCKGNLVKMIKKDERRYYEDLLLYSREHLMLYPYHLADMVVKGMRVTPFNYYINIMSDIMGNDKSYDCLPNFAAADCLRLLGIGRNQYIDLMNQCRSSKKFFRKKPIRELLPPQPVEDFAMEHWWIAQTGFVSEDDIKLCSLSEKKAVDIIIDKGPQLVAEMNIKVLHSLYRKGLIYLDVPIDDDDCIIVPPLEGFVMNRVMGDYFETLLYKIFVSIDENTSVAELASVLQIDLQLVKNAVSVYCRLGFAKKKTLETVHERELHLSWKNLNSMTKSKSVDDRLLLDWKDTILQNEGLPPLTDESTSRETISDDSQIAAPLGGKKRIAFVFDSTLTAFLMMGNLSPGLKSHAVTMFEVGKLSDESLDSFIAELERVRCDAEGEARRYFDHAITLRDTLKLLRYNPTLNSSGETDSRGPGIDLIRCESLLSLDPATRFRVLNKNYDLLLSMAPFSNEIRPVSSCSPQHIGPAIPEVSSLWFKLFIYHLTGSGPPSLLLVKGTRLQRLPSVFQNYDRLLITTWGHDPAVIAASNVLLVLNDALTHSAVLVQAYGYQADGQVMYIPFPLVDDPSESKSLIQCGQNHSAIKALSETIDLRYSAGYVSLLNPYGNSSSIQCDNDSDISVIKSSNDTSSSASIEVINEPENGVKDTVSAQILVTEVDSVNNTQLTDMSINLRLLSNDPDFTTESDWTLLECCYGVPLFSADLNKSVCTKILSHLSNKISLQNLLHYNRLITMQLLDFISEYQDVSVSLNQGHRDQQDDIVPLPTKSLLFSNQTLILWDGI